jgi:ribosomal protein L37AE/L43A
MKSDIKYKCKYCGCLEQSGDKGNIWCAKCGNDMIHGNLGFERIENARIIS